MNVDGTAGDSAGASRPLPPAESGPDGQKATSGAASRTGGADAVVAASGGPTVGLILDGVGLEPFFGRLVGGVHAAARRHGAVLLMVPAGSRRDVVVAARALSHGFDGVIHAANTTRELEPLAALNGAPVVLLNAVTCERETICVLPDDVQGGRMAASLLLQRGHHRIALIDAFDGGFVARRREVGVRAARATGEAASAHVLKVVASPDVAGGYRAGVVALTRAAPATAIVCVNDRMAMGAYRAAAELGLSVPDDVSIVAFGEADPVASGLCPALTTVEPPLSEMGERAVEILLGLLDGALDGEAPAVELEYTVVQRESVTAPRGAA